MSTTIPNWVPKYIRQVVDYRAGTTPTPERFNELYNLLILQGDYNSATLESLLTNLEGFDLEFEEVKHGNSQFQSDITTALNNAIFSITNAYKLADSNLGVQLTQAVELMLQDYVTAGNVRSLFEQEADHITAQVIATIGDDMVSLATLQSQLELTSTNILAEVSTTLQNYSTTIEMSAAIDLRAGSITQTVQEQINGVTQSLSQVQQTANQISWIVKSGTSESDFILTDHFASLISPTIDLTGYVTLHSLLDPNDVTTINGGYLTSTHIEATTGEIAGFDFTLEDSLTHDGGFIYNNPTLGKYMRISPFSSHRGDGTFNEAYGAIDLGMAEDGKNTIVHLRSDGYARFGFAEDTGASVRLNDFIRYDKGVSGATNTLLYTPNLKILKDGTVVDNRLAPEPLKGLVVTDNTFTIKVASGDVTYTMTKDEEGKITQLTQGGTIIPIVWS